jgi:hypothetical protein
VPDTTPNVVTIRVQQPGAAAAADKETKIGEAPFAGTVTRVAVIQDTTLTGANTDSRTLQLFNRGLAGAGTTKVAETAFTAGVNAPADDNTELTVITAASANVVVAGDVLEFKSLHVGGTGLADGGGQVIVEITRS